MTRKFGIASLAAGLSLSWAPVAEAHSLGVANAGFLSGFSHPLAGIDHVLVMVAIGVWAAQFGGRALWRLPLTFVAVMIVGALIAGAGLAIPGVELGIAGSVVVIGGLIAFAVTLRPALGVALVALFALAHGYAHGSNIPATVSALYYGLGFSLATAALHGVGIAAGVMARGRAWQPALRIGGGVIGVVGLALMVG